MGLPRPVPWSTAQPAAVRPENRYPPATALPPCTRDDRHRSIRRGVAELLDASGGIDLLVNNAGINIPKPAVEITEQDWDSVLGTNLRGSFFLTTELAKSC